MAITNKDVEKLKEVFVTREEFKSELSKLATKDDFNTLKTDVDMLKTDVQALKDGQKKMEDKVSKLEDKMITRLDKILSGQEKEKEDRLFAKEKDDELDRRLNVLEVKVGV